MNIHDAIMKAADHIEIHPREFSFEEPEVPHKCGSPGCALGWVGHFLGRPASIKKDEYFGHSAVATIMGLDSGEFYERLTQLEGKRGQPWVAGEWSRDPGVCARVLRLYAAKYHAPAKPRRTDEELTRHWLAVMRQRHIEEHAQSEELTW